MGGGFAAVVVFASFVRWELARAEPMLQLRMFAKRAFTFAVLTRLLGFMAATINRSYSPSS